MNEEDMYVIYHFVGFVSLEFRYSMAPGLIQRNARTMYEGRYIRVPARYNMLAPVRMIPDC